MHHTYLEGLTCAVELLSIMPPQPWMKLESDNGVRTRSFPGTPEYCPPGYFANRYQAKVRGLQNVLICVDIMQICVQLSKFMNKKRV